MSDASRWRISGTSWEKLALYSKNLRKFWKEYRRNLGGMTGLGVLVFFVIMALTAGVFSTVKDPDSTENLELNIPDIDWMNPHAPSLSPSPYSGFTHPLGTDFQGKDVYSMMLYGARASLIVGILASMISMLLGTGIGIASGYLGRGYDEVLMRLTDFFLVIPWFPLAIVISFVLGPSFWNVILVIGIVSWPSTTRIVRAQVLSTKERIFVERSRCFGAGASWIIRKHIMPNILPLIFANTVLLVANSIFMEAFLDFFGFGDPDVISWGLMLEEAYSYGGFSAMYWWPIMPPGTCIVMLVMGFYLMGDAIDDLVNPRLRRR